MKKHLLTAAATASILFANYGGSACASGTSYTVKAGDTLWSISQTNHISVSDLKSWNHLSSNTIYVNEKLLLVAPTISATQPASSNGSYTVISGDTIYGIAKKYNMTIAQIKSLNGLTTDLIHVGQVLKVSGTVSVTSKTLAAPVSTTLSKSQMIIDEAKKYIGVPYLWGGATPAGFDCSGYVQFVYSKVGVSIPRTTATQWAGIKSISTAAPGDLVFFNTNGIGVSHVGIYLGKNQFIHAGSTGIMISDMSTSYWKPKYLGARTVN
jgi:peptidoglycan DL-endopeptidase LytE